MGWRKGGYGSREVNILIKGAILGFARDLSLEGFPGPRRGPQIVPWAAEERVPELALSHSHTDEYLAYHHRTFIWQWMEIETDWSTGLNSQGSNEEQKEGEHEQGSQDHEGCIHPLRQWD